MKWFGQSWGAPVCKPETHSETPTEEDCTQCEQPILATDSGVTLPFSGGPDDTRTELSYHHQCYMRSLGLDRFPPGYGANHMRPVVRVAHSALALDSPGESDFRAVCPVCKQGVLRVQRDQATLHLSRRDYCSRCVQRFWYTDNEIAGEPMPGIGEA